MKKKISSKKEIEKKSDEPAWLYDDPNQGPIKYSEKDYDQFADGFIRSNSDLPEIKKMIESLGLKGAKEKIKKALKIKHKNAEILSKLN